MSVLSWSPEKRLTVELRKALNGARRSGASTEFATLLPSELPEDLGVPPGEPICAAVTRLSGRRLYFSDRSVYVEQAAGFGRLQYDSVVACEWIADTSDLKTKAALKREHGDRLILRDAQGTTYELDHLGRSFQGLYSFFLWLLTRGEAPSNASQLANGAVKLDAARS